jgi:hypothetical protein
MEKKMLDEFIEFMALLMFEIFASFVAMGLILMSIIFLGLDFMLSGIICLILGVVFILLFIGGFKAYLRGKWK